MMQGQYDQYLVLAIESPTLKNWTKDMTRSFGEVKMVINPEKSLPSLITKDTYVKKNASFLTLCVGKDEKQR